MKWKNAPSNLRCTSLEGLIEDKVRNLWLEWQGKENCPGVRAKLGARIWSTWLETGAMICLNCQRHFNNSSGAMTSQRTTTSSSVARPSVLSCPTWCVWVSTHFLGVWARRSTRSNPARVLQMSRLRRAL